MAQTRIIEALQSVFDPEISVNIYDLGLIYKIKDTDTSVAIEMTLTSPMCPAADQIINDVYQRIHGLGYSNVDIDITFDPPWDPSKISDEGKLELGIFYDPPEY